MKKLLGIILSLALGALVGFFVVFNSVFSDSGSSPGERLFTFVLVIAVYGIIGFALGMLVPGKPLLWSVVTCLPAAVILVWYAFREPGVILYSIAYLVLAFLSVYLAAHLSDNAKHRQR
jgi:hypothetical protein